MINLNESYVAKLGFELATPGSAVRHATDCTMSLTMLLEMMNALKVTLCNWHVSLFPNSFMKSSLSYEIDIHAKKKDADVQSREQDMCVTE